MRSSAYNRYVVLWLFAVAVVAGLLTAQGVCVGDDLGYCFADAKLHGGDGGRVESFFQILTTQVSHFLRFNGRFIVHSLTQMWLMEGFRIAYCVCNGLMFGLLWIGMMRLADLRFTWRSASLSLLMLLLLFPAPGVICFSLVAFSLNYLWPGVLCVWLLIFIFKRTGEGRPSVWLLLGTFVAGALQESYSLPLTGALFITFFIYRRRDLLWYAVAMGVGTLALLLAPGNYAHAAAGGGFAAGVIAHKTLSMLCALLRTPLPLLAALYAACFFSRCLRAVCRVSVVESLLLAAIICSLLLGVVSFTALRQLVAPSIWSLVILFRIGGRVSGSFTPRYSRIVAGLSLAGCLCLLTGAFMVREETRLRVVSVSEAIADGHGIVWTDNSTASYNAPYAPLLRGWDDDPFADDLLHIVFDANTRKGLRRMYGGGRLRRMPEIIPVVEDSLRKAGRCLSIRRRVGITEPRPLDAAYSLIIVPNLKKLPKLCDTDGGRLPFASVRLGDTIYMIVPATARQLIIAKI